MHWARWDGGDLILMVRAHPGARRTDVNGVHDHALRISLNAPAADDKANRALIDYLADAFGVARRDVHLEYGGHARQKCLRIAAPARVPGWFDALGGVRPSSS